MPAFTPERQLARRFPGAGAKGSAGASAAGPICKAHMHGAGAPSVVAGHLVHAHMPPRADDGAGVAVDAECRDVVALAGLGLPARVWPDRADQLDPMLGFGIDQQRL